MAKKPDHEVINPAHLSGPQAIVAGLFGMKSMLFIADYLDMKYWHTQRSRELTSDHLICRFCGNPIDLIGAWICTCGYKRPGNYFGRCPKCLKYPHYIDCPVCRFTMEVR